MVNKSQGSTPSIMACRYDRLYLLSLLQCTQYLTFHLSQLLNTSLEKQIRFFRNWLVIIVIFAYK